MTMWVKHTDELSQAERECGYCVLSVGDKTYTCAPQWCSTREEAEHFCKGFGGAFIVVDIIK